MRLPRVQGPVWTGLLSAVFITSAGMVLGESSLFPLCPMMSCGNAGASRELFDDPGFTRGFRLSTRAPWDRPNELGFLVPEGRHTTDPPAWRLAQWHAATLLEPGIMARDGDSDAWTARTETRQVTVRRDNGVTTVVLACQGGREYGGRLRQRGEPWPHLLIEQRLDAPPLGDLVRLVFRFRFRVDGARADPALAAGLDPSLHTAQATAYWTVSVESKDGSRDMFWFGIPLFDIRYAVPPGSCQVDAGFPGATEKFIYTVAGDRFWSGATGDGAWRETETDLLPLLGEALRAIQDRGALKEALPETLRLTSFNLGWELPGPYDARLEVSGLSLNAVRSVPAERIGE